MLDLWTLWTVNQYKARTSTLFLVFIIISRRFDEMRYRIHFFLCFEIYLIAVLVQNSMATPFELCDVYDLNAETAWFVHVSSVVTCKANTFTEYFSLSAKNVVTLSKIKATHFCYLLTTCGSSEKVICDVNSKILISLFLLFLVKKNKEKIHSQMWVSRDMICYDVMVYIQQLVIRLKDIFPLAFNFNLYILCWFSFSNFATWRSIIYLRNKLQPS